MAQVVKKLRDDVIDILSLQGDRRGTSTGRLIKTVEMLLRASPKKQEIRERVARAAGCAKDYDEARVMLEGDVDAIMDMWKHACRELMKEPGLPYRRAFFFFTVAVGQQELRMLEQPDMRDVIGAALIVTVANISLGRS